MGKTLWRTQSRLGATLMIGVAVLSCTSAHASGDLLVAPTRLVLDSNRSSEIVLNNIGNETATYRVSLELRRMSPDGQLEEVTTPNDSEQAVLGMIAYAPRRVTLAPNQPQAIRVGVQPPAGLPDGEYRAHMLFRAIPLAQAATPNSGQSNGLSIALTPIYGVSIPIIVRRGQLVAGASIANVAFGKDEENKPAINLTLNRDGNRSVYGELRVTPHGQDKPIAQIRGVAIYPEITSRQVTLPLANDAAATFRGPAKVQYIADEASGGGVIAETDVVLK
ncbi:fimbrial biogenesis chaperone [Aquisediminimonas sediminicola]|uniref:fimbrial biogenesis chaperone n=1 Tax=Alteraquisediminimonas sediminicola TaxID=2676787 RepID=UPI001FE57E9C|nr:molecular chaperone [Aquisediminimonas sediminicola]